MYSPPIPPPPVVVATPYLQQHPPKIHAINVRPKGERITYVLSDDTTNTTHATNTTTPFIIQCCNTVSQTIIDITFCGAYCFLWCYDCCTYGTSFVLFLIVILIICIVVIVSTL